MENKKDMNIVLAVVVCLVLVGILIFISINNKVNMASNNVVNNAPVNTVTATGDIAKAGDVVSMNYTGRLENGTVFDASKLHDAPLQFEAGSGQMIKGFDDAVLGMKVGEEKEVTLQPAEAYGQINPSLLKKVPQSQLPLGQKIEKGMVLDIGLPTGQKIPARVVEVTLNDITIDLNHPLAGKVLKFKIKVVAIQGSTSV